MTWRTHLLVGANAVWLALLVAPLDQSILILLFAGAIGGLLPDIDASSAKVHYAGGGVLGGFAGFFTGKYFGHRGVFHSIFAALIWFVVLVIFLPSGFPALPLVFSAAYFSHSLIDGFNTGVGYFFPFYLKRFALVPRFLRSPVGGGADKFFFILGAFGLLLFFISNLPLLTNFSGSSLILR